MGLGDYRQIAERLLGAGEDAVRAARVGAGDDVLDVACGTGNATLPAARAGARVTGLDLTPELLEDARAAAAREALEIEWVAGDAADLPFGDASFDVVLSVFGSMFAPDHGATARETARVLRPGGRMALVCWTPDAFAGDFFATVGAFLPPPPEGFEPPLLWGTEAHVRELFEGTGMELGFDRGAVDFRFRSAAAATETYLEHFGPIVLARRHAEASGRVPELRDAVEAMYERQRTSVGGELRFDGDYLVVTGRREALQAPRRRVPDSLAAMAIELVHTNMRVRDIDASLRFYEALGFERRGKLDFGSAYNIYMGLPGDGDRLELTVNVGQDGAYDLGSGYGHVAVTVDDLDATLARLAEQGIEPEKPPYAPGGREEYRICFVADPDGYRIEMIDGGSFSTPQDP